MKRITGAFLLLFLFAAKSFSQTSDFGLWYSAGAGMDLTHYLDISLEGDIRTFDGGSKIDEGFGELGLSLKVFRFLSVGTAYRLTSKLENDNNYYLRHKFMFDVKGRTSLGRLGLSARFRLQRQDKTYIESLADEVPDYYGRIKLQAVYNLKKSKFEPNVYIETFSRMFETADKRIEKYRLSAGVAYKLSKKQKVDLSYIFQRDYIPHLSNLNIISLSYNFKL